MIRRMQCASPIRRLMLWMQFGWPLLSEVEAVVVLGLKRGGKKAASIFSPTAFDRQLLVVAFTFISFHIRISCLYAVAIVRTCYF